MGSSTLLYRSATRLVFGSLQGWLGPAIEGARPVHIETEAGALEGAVLEASTSARGVIVLCHPFLKYGMHYFVRAQLHTALNALGLHVVLFNFAGFGRSAVRGRPFVDDILALNDWVRAPLPRVHLGLSFGGYMLAHALCRSPAAFCSVVLDSPPVCVSRFLPAPVQAPVHGWLRDSAFAARMGLHPITHSLAGLTHSEVRVLAGDRDALLPAADLAQLRSRAPAVPIDSFADCAHIELFRREPQRYLGAIEKALARATSAGDETLNARP